MKIAVIGSGISGLIATEDLRSGHDVTLFESSAALGGHTNTVEIELDGERLCVDTGFIVFNDRTYPNFCARLDEWGVASQPTEMSFSVRCDAADLEYNGASLNKLFVQRRNLLRPGFHRMIRDILRFNREAASLATSRAGGDPRQTVADFLAAGRYSAEFAEHYLFPMGAAIWSCPVGAFSQFPVRFIAEFYHHHGLLSLRDRPLWRTVTGGSRRYIEALTRRWGREVEIRLNTPVASVRRLPGSVRLGTGGSEESFDHVVFACHSDQALQLLIDATPTEVEVLSRIPYGKNLAVLHTDARLLPRRRKAWASWNYLLGAADRRHSAPPTLTYCMNVLQNLRSRHTVCVTLNAEDQIDPGQILGRFQYEHPLFTTDRSAVLARHGELLNTNRTSFCGAYWGNGFHEDGVVSGMAVARAINSRPHLAAETRSRCAPLEAAS
jgi:uncharacterized protein